MREIQKKLTVLRRIAEALNAAQIEWAVGASLVLYFHGLTDEFHDIDIMVSEEDAERIRQILQTMGRLMPPHPDRKYQTKKFMEFVIDGADIDVMAGFAIVDEEHQVHDCSFTPDQIERYADLDGVRIPIQKISLWRQYYLWMGRTAKVQMIDRQNV